MSDAQLLLLALLFGPLAAFAAAVALWRLRQRPAPPDEGEPEDGPPAEEGRDPRW
jgi:hypothetical protein